MVELCMNFIHILWLLCTCPAYFACSWLGICAWASCPIKCLWKCYNIQQWYKCKYKLWIQCESTYNQNFLNLIIFSFWYNVGQEHENNTNNNVHSTQLQIRRSYSRLILLDLGMWIITFFTKMSKKIKIKLFFFFSSTNWRQAYVKKYFIDDCAQ